MAGRRRRELTQLFANPLERTHCVLATVGLHVSIYNLFTSLLSRFGWGSSDE